MLRPVARGVSINIFTFFAECIKCPQVVRKPVRFISLQDRPSSHAARIELDIKAKEMQLT